MVNVGVGEKVLVCVFLGGDVLGSLHDVDVQEGGLVPWGGSNNVNVLYNRWGLDDVVNVG